METIPEIKSKYFDIHLFKEGGGQFAIKTNFYHTTDPKLHVRRDSARFHIIQTFGFLEGFSKFMLLIIIGMDMTAWFMFSKEMVRP